MDRAGAPGVQPGNGGPAREANLETMVSDTVLAAVERDLEAFGALAQGALGASARELARQLDDPHNSATSKSLCARALAEILDRLRDLAPPKREADGIDELNRARQARRGNTAA